MLDIEEKSIKNIGEYYISKSHICYKCGYPWNPRNLEIIECSRCGHRVLQCPRCKNLEDIERGK